MIDAFLKYGVTSLRYFTAKERNNQQVRFLTSRVSKRKRGNRDRSNFSFFMEKKLRCYIERRQCIIKVNGQDYPSKMCFEIKMDVFLRRFLHSPEFWKPEGPISPRKSYPRPDHLRSRRLRDTVRARSRTDCFKIQFVVDVSTSLQPPTRLHIGTNSLKFEGAHEREAGKGRERGRKEHVGAILTTCAGRTTPLHELAGKS